MTSNSEQNKQKIQNTEKRKTSFSKKLVKNVYLAKKKKKKKTPYDFVSNYTQFLRGSF